MFFKGVGVEVGIEVVANMELGPGGHGAAGAGHFLLMSMGGQAKGLACADPVVRTPIGMSGNLLLFFTYNIQWQCTHCTPTHL